MSEQPISFGIELRRCRTARGWSLTRLAMAVHYSKGHLSKVETGLKRPTSELARLCDTVLCADGALAGLVPPHAATEAAPPSESRPDEEVWIMQRDSDGSVRFASMDRRHALTLGASCLLAVAAGEAHAAASPADAGLLQASRSLFDQYRRLGQSAEPGALVPPLVAQAQALCDLASRSAGGTRRGLLVLASRYAEFAGWMAQESGNDRAASWLTRRAVDLADAGGDRHLATYALARQALISFYAGDAPATIGLAGRAANTKDAPARIRGLAAQQEAQGHALAGDHRTCMRRLEAARAWLVADTEDPSLPVIGSSNLTDPVSMATGWCLYDLGRPHQAADILDTETARLPGHSVRNQVRYGMRRALSHAAAGDVEHACSVAGALLGPASQVGSATVRADIRRLARLLGRHSSNSAVREITPRLTSVLHPTA
ncbi:transcriptional regulator [Streptomyces sp. CB02923]|uniref:helix-turn-helix domain-containing protein n=1 Tax=Streptomyces sp. CB02923 TaxID=1718985 RepID=UPI00093B0A37|nr:helix-turn-helix transcriptional regulator [Streptomyces sp. CB02923]OKH98211.1 transcriptional regulator [Streptomyces sp. CB02923]